MVKIPEGVITAGALRAIFKDLKDEDPIVIMCVDADTYVGKEAVEINYDPPMNEEDKMKAIQRLEEEGDTDIWQAILWFGV